MAMIQRFEDIQAWQEARTLVKMIYQLTSKEKFSKDFGMRDQIRRASVSVMNNIAEGFDCESKAEFARFLGIARRSAVEVQSCFMRQWTWTILTKPNLMCIMNRRGKPKPLSAASNAR
jgi:four helix bundle protein